MPAFFDAAVTAGGELLHEPPLWPQYHAAYYRAFVRDPDGNNVATVCHFPQERGTSGREGRLSLCSHHYE